MKVGFLGTGILGFPMAERLLQSGHTVFVYNRTLSKAKPLQLSGARIAHSITDVLENTSVIILLLSDIKAISATILSHRKLLKDKTIIQMGTIGSADSIFLAQKIKQAGGDYCECPVLGSRTEAREKRLILMFGGSPAQYRRWQKLLMCFGTKPHYVGKVGQAAVLKLALNHLIASHAVAFSLSLGLIQKNLIDVSQFMSILKASSLFAPMFEKKLPSWLKKEYSNPNFSTQHMLKDVRLVLKEAKKCNLLSDGAQAAEKLFQKAMKRGFSQKDYCSVYNVIAGNK